MALSLILSFLLGLLAMNNVTCYVFLSFWVTATDLLTDWHRFNVTLYFISDAGSEESVICSGTDKMLA